MNWNGFVLGFRVEGFGGMLKYNHMEAAIEVWAYDVCLTMPLGRP